MGINRVIQILGIGFLLEKGTPLDIYLLKPIFQQYLIMPNYHHNRI